MLQRFLILVFKVRKKKNNFSYIADTETNRSKTQLPLSLLGTVSSWYRKIKILQ